MEKLSVKTRCSLLLTALMFLGTVASGSVLAGNGHHGLKSAKRVKKVKHAGWYVRLTAQSDGLEDKNTVFGYLKGASDGKDKFDAEALSASGSNYLYTTVYHTDFGSTNNYRSDYRAYKKLGKVSETWTIKVNSGDEFAVVTLSWDGLTLIRRDSAGQFSEKHIKGKKALRKMRLVDVQTGEVIDAFGGRKSTTYSFNMDGRHEREFKWLLLKNGEDVSYFEPQVVARRASLMATKNRSFQGDVMDHGFGPPIFEKR